ncbi:hypothetical protein FKO01_51830 [Mesorhizobium sp. B2-3-3]|uniref:hypothetical protein n=1 Tax=unclassified Mesorhizobium TaxID=325217 RepID=UPI00112A27F0|nr:MULTISPECIES: hypothetical protein [unclassified Mesorhizobium]TPK61178.1 hypothetical protein FJ930_28040 [Mesorhizobium sp. B2-4-15]TPM13630.1 hypothetical protein FJ958_30790 [Mesorhizobium sp. B2-3-5]TPM97572.1 hypothetical protein FKO01_51830 [Mesorhizobium sp. B2-3-3]
MKLSVLALASAILSLTFSAHAAPLSIDAPAHDRLIQQARVTCAYLTRDGYCVRPQRGHKHREYRHYDRHHRYDHYRRIFRTYEPPYYGRYYRPRPIIRVIPNYPPFYDDGWDY